MPSLTCDTSKGPRWGHTRRTAWMLTPLRLLPHRFSWHSLISDNETLLFRHFSDEWWPPAEHYLRYAAEYATHTGVRDRILFNWNVRSVERDESTAGMDFNEGKGGFIVSSTDGERMACRRVIAATGYSKEVMPEGVPGMEEHTVSYGDHDLDLSKYVNKSVLILGMGNTAFETANHLARVASWVHIFSRTGKPNMAWQTREWRAWSRLARRLTASTSHSTSDAQTTWGT